MQISVASIQLDTEPFEIEANLERATHLLRAVQHDSSGITVLPELFYTGYCFDQELLDLGATWGERMIDWLCKSSARCNSYLATSIVERDGGNLFDKFVLVSPSGDIQSYRKRHPAFFEKLYFKPGKDIGIFETPFCRVGVMVCWDIVHQDCLRELTGEIDVLLICSAWADLTTGSLALPFFQTWMTRQVKHRPAELSRILGVPVVFSNLTGAFRTRVPFLGVPYRAQFAGHSSIYDRHGTELQRQPSGEIVLTSVVDLPLAHKQGTTDTARSPELASAARLTPNKSVKNTRISS